MAEKVNRSTTMIRVPIPIADHLREVSRLFRENKLTPTVLESLISQLEQADSDQVDNHFEIVDNHSVTDQGLAAILEKLAQVETTILDRLEAQAQQQATPIRVLSTAQLMQERNVPYAQLAAAARTTGQTPESVLAQRTGFKYLGNGTFAGQ